MVQWLNVTLHTGGNSVGDVVWLEKIGEGSVHNVVHADLQ